MKITKELIFTPDRLEVSAWTGHIPFAAWLMQILKPRVFVELGSYYGNSYFAFCEAAVRAQLETMCYAVDTWQGDEHAGLYDQSVFESFSSYHERYQLFSTFLRTSFDEAQQKFADGTIDLLHIDGLHTYDAVRHDFETWKPKLSDRAVVLFHDMEVRERDFGVWKLWEELSSQYPAFSFYHSHGLGVLFFGKEIDGELKNSLLDEPPQEIQVIKDFFAHLGAQLELIAKHKRKKKKKRIKRLFEKLGVLVKNLTGNQADPRKST
ncbi:class I SAM-dependent methyltransferase [Methylacidiphilales bacterium]|nr:class I SAM-dependent methyltransferase [Candidatus Methylacidiphilales bacterium]